MLILSIVGWNDQKQKPKNKFEKQIFTYLTLKTGLDIVNHPSEICVDAKAKKKNEKNWKQIFF